MNTPIRRTAAQIILFSMSLLTGSEALAQSSASLAQAPTGFGPSNPFYKPSTLPFQAPPFDKITDEDYQPAIEAGMAQQKAEIEAIANNPDAPTFDNTFVALEKKRPVTRPRHGSLRRSHRSQH